MAQFADMLRYLRKREGLTQSELAERTGVSRSRINNYENGIREPDFETAEIFADFFNVNLDTLIGRNAEIKKPVAKMDDGIQQKYLDLMQIFSQLSEEDLDELTAKAQSLLQNRTIQDDQ